MPRGENQKLKLLYLLDILNENTDDEHFIACVSVAVSIQFLGWIMSLGEGVKLIGPDEVVEKMRYEVERLKNTYLDN